AGDQAVAPGEALGDVRGRGVGGARVGHEGDAGLQAGGGAADDVDPVVAAEAGDVGAEDVVAGEVGVRPPEAAGLEVVGAVVDVPAGVDRAEPEGAVVGELVLAVDGGLV